MSLNLAVILRESARRDPDRVAIMLDAFKFTYGQLDALSNQVASSLKAAGLKKGDRVGLMLPNVPQFPIAYFAILKAGGVVVPINVLLKAPEVSFYMGDSGARYLVVWDDSRPRRSGASQISMPSPHSWRLGRAVPRRPGERGTSSN